MAEGNQKRNTLAIVALVFSLLLCAPIFPLTGLILGLVALGKTKKDPSLGGRNTALAAIIVGGLFCIASLGIMGQSFIGYLERARNSEAEDKISEMYRSAASYASQELVGPAGQQQQPQLPVSAPLTPAQSCCGSSDRRCDPMTYGVSQWDAPTWQALNFAISDRHYFRYEFVSDGASFTARAVGDLDCDGNSFTLERSGTILPDGDLQGSRGVARSGDD